MSKDLQNSPEKKNGHKLTHKLTGEAEKRLFILLAEGEKPREIVKVIKEEYSIQITPGAVYKRRYSNPDKIDIARKQLTFRIKSIITTANVFNRMKIREKLIEDLIGKLDEKSIASHKTINDLLNSQRVEMEALGEDSERDDILHRLFTMSGEEIEKMFEYMYGKITVKLKDDMH